MISSKEMEKTPKVTRRKRYRGTTRKFRGKKRADNLVLEEKRGPEIDRQAPGDCEFLDTCKHPPHFEYNPYWCRGRYWLCSLHYRTKNNIEPQDF